MSRGTAEYLVSVKLTNGSRGCKHFRKIRAGESDCPFPSILGFFHESDDNISYLEISKLCATCCHDAVPDGYNSWSVSFNEPQSDDTHSNTPASSLLDISPSQEFYPPIFQAGTEIFAASRSAVNSETHSAEPARVALPDVPDAAPAWRWLKSERKPFYLDQLHLVKDKSPMVRQNAARDARIAFVKSATYHQHVKESRAERESAEMEEAQREQAQREQVQGEQVQREQVQREQVQREQVQREQVQREQEKAEKEKTDKARLERENARREKTQKEKTEREKAEIEKMQKDKSESEKPQREKAEREKMQNDKSESEKSQREKSGTQESGRPNSERERTESENSGRRKSSKEKERGEEAGREYAKNEKAKEDDVDNVKADEDSLQIPKDNQPVKPVRFL